jgi:hypothetical protein
MKAMGVTPERLALEWASAAEAPLYVELITNFTKEIKELGPLGEAEGVSLEYLKLKLLAGRSAVQNVKLRTRFAKLGLELRDKREYIPELIEEKMTGKINEAIISEIERQEKKLTESAEQGAQ